jgi:HlyD family secretion protein
VRGSVQVKLRVTDPPPYLRQDMSVSVDIEVARKPAAILLPTESVRDADTAAPWVLKVEDGRVHRRPVKLGLRSKGWCEILQGVRPGDQVVPATAARAATLADGARVRPVAAAGG